MRCVESHSRSIPMLSLPRGALVWSIRGVNCALNRRTTGLWSRFRLGVPSCRPGNWGNGRAARREQHARSLRRRREVAMMKWCTDCSRSCRARVPPGRRPGRPGGAGQRASSIRRAQRKMPTTPRGHRHHSDQRTHQPSCARKHRSTASRSLKTRRSYTSFPVYPPPALLLPLASSPVPPGGPRP